MAVFNRHDLDAVLELPRGADPSASAASAKPPSGRKWRRASEWLLTETTTAGERIAVRGCDLWEFRDGLVVRKDSYWKIVG